jgi:hypothetical protein
MSFRRSIFAGLPGAQDPRDYKHPEAFCLMKYQSEDGEEEEILWNTRDGVTPFFIGNKAGTKSMKHINWNEDVRAINHKPQPGDRVFMDLSKEDYISYTKVNVDKMWDGDGVKMSDHFETKEQAIESLSSNWQEGTPCVRVVSKEGWPNLESEIWD